MANKSTKKKLRWSQSDEKRLISNIKKNPANLRKAFQQTSIEIGRTEKACTYHWYKVTSKKKHVLLLTLSGSHVSPNRKNGKGQPLKLPLYKRVLAMLGFSY